MQAFLYRPNAIQRAEGAVALLLSVVLYARFGSGWILFALLLFTPDVSMLGYLRGPRVGAALYNGVHTYAGPLLLGAAAVLLDLPLGLNLALIWAAHIGLDRALGYGLKLPGGFRETHLGMIGPSDRAALGNALKFTESGGEVRVSATGRPRQGRVQRLR